LALLITEEAELSEDGDRSDEAPKREKERQKEPGKEEAMHPGSKSDASHFPKRVKEAS